MKFKYKVVGLGQFRADHEQAIQSLGAEGWELVAVSGNYAYLKKQSPMSSDWASILQPVQPTVAAYLKQGPPIESNKPVPQSTPKGGEATAPPASAEPKQRSDAKGKSEVRREKP